MIIHSFDPDSESVVTLEAFYGPKRHLVDHCLIIFSIEIYNYLLNHYTCKEIASIHACNGVLPIYSLEYKDRSIAFYLTALGSTMCAGITAEVNHVIGAKYFIMFGSCGSLDASKTKNRYIIPTEAYRDEGMSYHYKEPTDYITIKNSDHLAAIFNQLHIPYVQGRVWTTDAMLRETRNQVVKRKEEGCIAVEMELAGVQAVSDFYGYELYDFLQAGDVLLEEEYEVDGLKRANHDLDKLMIALEISTFLD